MKKGIFTITACMFCVIASASPFNSREVSATAKWLVHANLEQLKTTEVGKCMIKGVNDKEFNDLLDSFEEIFNFDPLADIDGITLYGSGGEENGVILLRGRFDGKKMNDLLNINKTHKSKAYGKHQIHSWADAAEKTPVPEAAKAEVETPTFGAIYNNNLVLISGKEEYITNALDVLDGKAQSLHKSPLISNLKELPQTDFIMAVADTCGIKDLDPQAVILKKTQMVIFGMGEADGKITGSLILDAKGATEAQTLKAVADGMLAMAAMQTDDTPEIAMLAKAINIDINGSRIKVSMAMPVAEIIKSIEKSRVEGEEKPAGKKDIVKGGSSLASSEK